MINENEILNEISKDEDWEGFWDYENIQKFGLKAISLTEKKCRSEELKFLKTIEIPHINMGIDIHNRIKDLEAKDND